MDSLRSDINIERKKYEKIYAMGLWRTEAEPQMEHLDIFIDKCLRPHHRIAGYPVLVTDFGCGSGYAALTLRALGYVVNVVDLVPNCLGKGAKIAFGGRFICAPLHELPLTLPRADWGYCTDVMEHVPEDLVRRSLAAISLKAEHVCFSICGRPDGDGGMIGEKLHVTIKPMEWWVDEIRQFWEKVSFIRYGHDQTFIIIGRNEK